MNYEYGTDKIVADRSVEPLQISLLSLLRCATFTGDVDGLLVAITLGPAYDYIATSVIGHDYSIIAQVATALGYSSSHRQFKFWT